MKIKLKNKVGRWLMGLGGITICIIDDEEIYFSEGLLNLAKENGFKKIERHHLVDKKLLQNLHEQPRDIIVLDIQGVTTPDVAKDGLHLASSLTKTTTTYVAITSAHKFHLTNRITEVDYVIDDRLLTAVDFLDELTNMVEDYLEKKTAFYKKVIFKAGFALAKQGVA